MGMLPGLRMNSRAWYGGLRCDGVNVHFELFAKGLERQVIHVVAERVLDFCADLGDAQDNVGGEDAAGDGDPLQTGPQLERQHHDVDPGDLRNGNRVGDGERSLKDTVHAGQGFVELDNTVDCVRE